MRRNRSIVVDTSEYGRLRLKNGWDPDAGEKAPATGRKRSDARAHELLVMKTDEEYEQEAERTRQIREENQRRKKVDAARLILTEAGDPDGHLLAGQPAAEKEPAFAERPAFADNTGDLHGLKAMSEEEYRRKGRRRLQIILLGIILLLAAVDARLAFGPPLLLADISGYENVEIEVDGLAEEPVMITAKDLSKMRLTKVKVDVHQGELAEGEVPELGIALGPTLDEFLKQYGKTTDDFRSMKVYNENDKSTAYVRTMKEETVVLSIANGRTPLGEKEAPLRIAVDGEDPGQWSGWIRRIVFTE
ncbi:MAG: hypothetical protein IJ128_06910 [Firmicutes bacterium]|nr:hypothetical protein [Bacillota bacterium]